MAVATGGRWTPGRRAKLRRPTDLLNGRRGVLEKYGLPRSSDGFATEEPAEGAGELLNAGKYELRQFL